MVITLQTRVPARSKLDDRPPEGTCDGSLRYDDARERVALFLTERGTAYWRARSAIQGGITMRGLPPSSLSLNRGSSRR